ncbi:MAG: hypothetical protein AB1486_33705 [Planctomycetota bacterium]
MRLPSEVLRKMNVSLETNGRSVRVYVEGQLRFAHELAYGEVHGRVGLVVQGCKASFSNLRVHARAIH